LVIAKRGFGSPRRLIYRTCRVVAQRRRKRSEGETKSVVREKNVLCANPAPVRIVVASLGYPNRLHCKVDPGVADVDDLQVTHGAARTEFSSADLIKAINPPGFASRTKRSVNITSSLFVAKIERFP
jgi:hypothetical protein